MSNAARWWVLILAFALRKETQFVLFSRRCYGVNARECTTGPTKTAEPHGFEEKLACKLVAIDPVSGFVFLGG